MCKLREEIKWSESDPIQDFILKWKQHLVVVRISKSVLVKIYICIYQAVASADLLPIYESACNSRTKSSETALVRTYLTNCFICA